MAADTATSCTLTRPPSETQTSIRNVALVVTLTAVAVLFILAVCLVAAVRRSSRRITSTIDLPAIKVASRKAFETRYERLIQITPQLGTPRIAIRALETGLDAVTVQTKLAKGTYGPIYAGMKDGRAVRIESCEDQDVSSMQHFVVQCQLYHCLDHPNILKLEFVHLATQPLHRGFEAVDVGTLSQYLTARRPKLEQRLRIIQQVVGVQYP